MQTNQAFSSTPMDMDGNLIYSTPGSNTLYSTQPTTTQYITQPGTYTTTTPTQYSTPPTVPFTTSIRTTLPPSSFTSPALLPTSTYTGTNTMTPAYPGAPIGAPLGGQLPMLPLGQQLPGNTQLGNTKVSELELKKRILDNDREVQLKYADKESDLQKKLEDKAEKQREKAAKWKVKGVNSFANRHEKKSVKLETKAHQHYMRAEDYKTVAKNIERERKQYDPPQEKKDEKKPIGKKADVDVKKSTGGIADDKKAAVETKKDAVDTSKDIQLQKQTTSPSFDANRPKKAVIEEKPSHDARYQQDVSTAALRYANSMDNTKAAQEQAALQQQVGAVNLGVPRS